MSDTNPLEAQFKKIWQKVPQEERSEILTRAQGKAVEVCSLVTIFGCTAAFGLDMPWILLGVAALLPVLFQVVVTRTWIDSKPQTIARYFMASRTATQYARALGITNPAPKTIFRGSLLPIREPDPAMDPEFATEYAEEVASATPIQKEVWISLFSDSLVMFSENPEGARLEFKSSILHDFAVNLDSPEDMSGNPLPQQLVIQAAEEDGSLSRWLVTSPHTSSLLACERKVRFFIQRAEALAAEQPLPAPEETSHSLFASNQLGATLEAVSH
jgi:hypothetical protein